MKLTALALVCGLCMLSQAQNKPGQKAARAVAVQAKMKATEAKFAKMAESSGKASAQLEKINAELDQLLKTLRDFHLRVSPKPPA